MGGGGAVFTFTDSVIVITSEHSAAKCLSCLQERLGDETPVANTSAQEGQIDCSQTRIQILQYGISDIV
jgi:hypothetical protein